HLVHLAGLWLMVVSASRTSFISYLFGLVLIILIISWQKKDWTKRIKWGLSRSLILAFLISVMMLKFGTDMYERFLQTLGSYPKINYSYHQLNAKRKNLVTWIKVQLKLEEKYFKAEIPKNAISLEEAQKLENVLVESDQRPVPQKPSDVYVDVPDYVEVATISAEGKETTIIEARERTWSANAIKHGLSLAIRLDELWPRAIQGFMRNPLLGSGYATLNKEGSTHFTEAESTDNNFLRTLGETGLLGFLSFYGVILLAIYIAAQFVNHKKTLLSAVSIAFIVASISLLVNAIYIDVYAASKVAYTYWTLVGLTMAYCYLGSNKRDLEKNKFIKFIQKIRKSIVRDVRKSKS
ncbi:MAG: O-antigen ligase family protein, partial [Candidatus Woesebacteria bacterium]